MFASGAVRVLIATDIAARGIHVDGIGLVIHADSPAEHKAYLHRSGVVITLLTPAQAHEVRTLMRRAGVVPVAATVSPRSPLLRSIAGPPARPVPRPERPAAPTLAAMPATGRGAVAASAGRADLEYAGHPPRWKGWLLSKFAIVEGARSFGSGRRVVCLAPPRAA